MKKSFKFFFKYISYIIALVFVVQWIEISASSVFASDFHTVGKEHPISTIVADTDEPNQPAENENEDEETAEDTPSEEDNFNSTASVFSTTMGKYSLILVGCSIILVGVAGYYAANKKAE